MGSLVVFATESGIPPSAWQAKLAVPIGIVLFLGSVYLLLRANLGTRRGYLVLGTSLFAFLTIYSLFWAFGAPGTPPTTGPQNLPGQEADAYLPVWRPFAPDSLLAEREPYAELVAGYPETFGPVPEDFEETAEEGVAEIQSFFSSTELFQPPPLGATWEDAEVSYAVADNGFPVIAVQFQETFQPTADGTEPAGPVGEIDPEGDTALFFSFFDAGSPRFPSYVFITASLLLFALHAFLLDRDELRERRELAGEESVEAEPVRVES